MRVALTCGPLEIPPTYFVVQHAMLLQNRHDFALFSPSAVVHDDIGVPAFSAMRLRPGSRIDALRVQAAAPRVAGAIRRFGPQLIHQHFATWSLPATSVARRAQVPLITTLHGYDVFAFSRQAPGVWGAITRANLRASAHYTTRFLAVSGWLADQALRAGIDQRRLRVMYQGIDTAFFTPGASDAIDGDPAVLFVGGLVERKGVRDAVDASIRMYPAVPHRLRVAGDGPLAAEIHAAAREHRHIEVLGPLSRSALRDEYRTARVLVMPSRSSPAWSEAAGLVSLEAQACGTPVVAYSSGGIPEMIRDSTTGTVVPQDDIGALESALRAWLTMPDADHADHGNRAVDFVRTERSAAGAARELLRHYDEVAADRGGPATTDSLL